MRKALAAAAWVGGFTVIDTAADGEGLSVTKLCRSVRREIGPVAFDLILVGVAIGFRQHLKEQ